MAPCDCGPSCRVRKTLDLIKEGLWPFAETQLAKLYEENNWRSILRENNREINGEGDEPIHWESSLLLKVLGDTLWEHIRDSSETKYVVPNLAYSLVGVRNFHAHEHCLTNIEIQTAIGNAVKLLEILKRYGVSVQEQLEAMKELYKEQLRTSASDDTKGRAYRESPQRIEIEEILNLLKRSLPSYIKNFQDIGEESSTVLALLHNLRNIFKSKHDKEKELGKKSDEKERQSRNLVQVLIDVSHYHHEQRSFSDRDVLVAIGSTVMLLNNAYARTQTNKVKKLHAEAEELYNEQLNFSFSRIDQTRNFVESKIDIAEGQRAEAKTLHAEAKRRRNEAEALHVEAKEQRAQIDAKEILPQARESKRPSRSPIRQAALPLPVDSLGDLSRFSVFKGLSVDELARLQPALGIVRFQPQEDLYAPGDSLEALYLLQEGRIQIKQNGAIHLLHPYTPVGIQYLMDDRPSEEHAFASSEIRLISMARDSLVTLATEIPQFRANLWDEVDPSPPAVSVPPPPPEPEPKSDPPLPVQSEPTSISPNPVQPTPSPIYPPLVREEPAPAPTYVPMQPNSVDGNGVDVGEPVPSTNGVEVEPVTTSSIPPSSSSPTETPLSANDPFLDPKLNGAGLSHSLAQMGIGGKIRISLTVIFLLYFSVMAVQWML